jgi:hypothetical protein
MREKIKKVLRKIPYSDRTIFPIYALGRYCVNFIRFGTIDPVNHFVFKKHKLVYVVMPKVAQTAICNTCGNKEKKEYTKIKDLGIGEKKWKLSPEEKDYYTFTFVRNPFERLYSCHQSKYIADRDKYKRDILDFDYYMMGTWRKDPGFKKFVDKVCKMPDRLSDRHFKSQNLIANINAQTDIDYIGKYENLHEDFKKIQEKYGLDPLPHLNKSNNKKVDWRDSYTKEMVEKVYKRYKKDFELWYPNAKQELLDYIGNKSKSE